MRVLLALALLLLVMPVATAQAPRPVLIEACNDTPFGIGLAAAYQNDPSSRHVVQGWFQIAAGDCLEGRLADIVGNQALIGVVSGEWRWPAQSPDANYCTPAETFFNAARSENCAEVERLTSFERVSITPYRSGWGRIQVRFSCDDFTGEDAELCRQNPQGLDGMAAPLRTLEICNTWSEPADIVTGAARSFEAFEVSGWSRVEAGECQTVYRGFPYNNEVWFAARGVNGRQSRLRLDGQICVTSEPFSETAGQASLVNAAQCPADLTDVIPAARVQFGRYVARYQDYTPAD